MSGDEDNGRRSKETQDLERSTHPQPRENFFSRALFALAAKWGMKKYCRLVEISYNDTFKLKGLPKPFVYDTFAGEKLWFLIRIKGCCLCIPIILYV